MATVDHHNNNPNHHHNHHLHLEYLPLVDLRLLTQSELLSLSRCSSASLSSSTTTRSSLNDDDDVVSTPKIDRNVFNESAGSRKQTFYRLRLAPPRGASDSNESSSSSRIFRNNAQENFASDAENSQIVSLLKSLFAIESNQEEEENDENLFPVNIEFRDYLHFPLPPVINNEGNNYSTSSIVVGPGNVSGDGQRKRKRGRPRKYETQNNNSNNGINNYGCNNVISVGVSVSVGAVSCSEGKRRRGRPRKNEGANTTNNNNGKAIVEVKEENKEEKFALVNGNGFNVDLAALERVEDPFGEEIRRRTHGLDTQEKLLGFLSGLNGEWVSIRRKRRIVDASIFGYALPKGWKLMLSLKRNAGHIWLVCRRYISPNGQQFVSCKEVATYLLSFSRLPEVSQPSCDHIYDNIQLHNKSTSVNAADVLHYDKNGADPVGCLPVPITSISPGNEKLDTLSNLGTPGNIQRGDILKCHKCPMTFGMSDDFLHHLLYSHQRVAKKSSHSASTTEAVIMKDGRYECQLCHKLFEERHRYNGHLGIHIKMYVKRLQETKTDGPASDSVLPEVLKMPDTRTDLDSVGNTFNALGRSSGFPYDDIKAASTYPNNYSDEKNLLSFGRRATETDTTDKNLVIENKGNDNVEQVTAETDNTAADVNVCLGAGTAIFGNENSNQCKPSDKADILKCTTIGNNNFVRQESPCNYFVTPASNQACAIGNDGNRVSTGLMEEHKLAIGSKISSLALKGGEKSFNYENLPVSGFGDRHIMLDEVLTNANEQISEGCSAIPSGDEQKRGFLIDMTGALTVQKKGSESGLPSSVAEQAYAVGNNLQSTCTSTMNEPKSDEIDKYGNDELTIDLFGSEQFVGLDNNVNKMSARAMEVPKLNKVRNSSKLVCAVGSRDTGIIAGLMTSVDQERSFNDSFLVSSLGDQSYASKNDAVSNSTPKHLEQDKSSQSSLIRSSGNEQTFDVDNNLNKESSQQLQSSDCFPTYDMIVDKGERELFASSFDGLRSDNTEQMEYNFFGEQTNSYSEDSKAFSYDTGMALGFDSSSWLEKEASHVLPKTSNRCQVLTVCVWCGNEIHQDTFEVGQQTGSIGYICASCKAKFSN